MNYIYLQQISEIININVQLPIQIGINKTYCLWKWSNVT